MRKKNRRRAEPNLSNDEFLSRLRNREPEAVAVIVRAYTEHIYRAALGLGFDTHAAQDLTQAVWMTFFDVVERFEGRSHVRTFVFGILYNKASELRREQSRLSATDPVEEVLDSHFDDRGAWIKPPIDPERFFGAAETLSIIEKCLEALPLTQRMAFTLREIQEEETPAICQILKVTVSNLGVLLYRARNRLRECIESKTAA